MVDVADSALTAIGLRAGDRVRFRRKDGGRWQAATVVGVERDGSIGVRDGKGAWRALAAERLEVRTSGPRGATTWEPLLERAARAEQLPLW
jgi:hypothetical protein